MRKIISFLAGASLVISPAIAADNVTVKDASGSTVTTASKDVGGVQFRKDICVTLADTTVDCFTTLNSTVKAEDAASANADSGIVINTKRLDTAAASSGTDGDYQPFITDGSGRLWTNVGALPAFIGSGSAAVIQTGACATLEGCIRSMRDSLYAMETDTNPVAITNDGTNVLRVRDNASATPVRIVSAAASTNLTEIADSGGCRVISISGAVARTSPVYLKLYNAADGSVTVGTTTPYITIPLPAGGTNPTSFQFDVNQTFASAACSLAMTTAVADNSTAALTAADVVGLTVLWAVQ